ncbi:MAG: D-aminoacyl-tRNA deacylase [Bacteroidales bacterium]|nr:D-aminoacyl-tRNA deacylase [Bacteroidales bacterium]MDD3521520.1 D-aminoacyl-tRNA deacylase [Bacteroidales bacterium]MDD4031337.1 D-aminoacyl-tRNA deacylase [Bacteroidales bacterium]MDD4436225.1 D-aminoacyl-tRNA deacylase [Bacteroidales bacterium]
MRTVIQRVKEASVFIDGKSKAAIGEGLLILAGFETSDTGQDLEWMVHKILNLRIFDDPQGVINLSVLQAGGQLLVVSQFTLHASTKKGNRPSYIKAAVPDIAVPLYESFCTLLENQSGIKLQTGIFGAAMEVKLTNNGPVTIIMDSKNRE